MSHRTTVLPKRFIASSILHQLAELHHVVVPAGEAGGEHGVLGRIDRDVVAVAVATVRGGHAIGLDQIAFVGEHRHPGHPAVIVAVGEELHQHASRRRVEGVRSNQAGLARQIGKRAHQLRPGRIGVDVEDVDDAVVEPTRPQIAAILGEAHVMRLAAPPDGQGLDDLPVAGRSGLHVDRDQLVRAIAHALDAQGPDVDVVLLALDEIAHERRVAGLVGAHRVDRHERHCGNESYGKGASQDADAG